MVAVCTAGATLKAATTDDANATAHNDGHRDKPINQKSKAFV